MKNPLETPPATQSEETNPGAIFHDKSEEKHLRDLFKVGPQKPLGYLPTDTIVRKCGVNIEELKAHLLQTGKHYVVYAPREGTSDENPYELLFVYDEMHSNRTSTSQKIRLFWSATIGLRSVRNLRFRWVAPLQLITKRCLTLSLMLLQIIEIQDIHVTVD